MSMTAMTIPWTIHETTLGPLTLRGTARGLSELSFPGRGAPHDEAARAPDLFTDAVRQLDEYFAGERHCFDLDLDLAGTPFQRAVWERLTQIPYGTTVTYGAIARE